MKSINGHIHFLSLFASASRQQRKALLQSMIKSQQHALLEVVFNVAKGTEEVSSWHKTILKRYKRIIRQVIDGQVGEKKKVSLLVKHSDIFQRIVKIALKQILDDGSRISINTKRRI